MMELTEDFLKLLQIAFIVTGVLAIFFTYIQYNILVSRDVAEREAYVFGDYMLSSPCLVYSDGMRLKSVFDESRLDSLVSNHDCIRYENYMLEISLLDNSKSWKIGDIDDVTGSASFSVAVRMNSETKPAIMKVSIEKLVVLPVQEMVSCVEQCVSLGFEKGECASAGTEGTSGATGSSGDTSGILTFTGIGTDYLLHYDGGSAERWISEGWIDNIAAYKSKGYVASRLGFRFTQGTITGWASGSSALDYTKFDRVLEIFDSRGLKVIPVAWDDQSMKSAFLSTYKQDWINFASHYINDDRIVAFELGNEPNTPMLNDWIETTNGFYQTPRDYYRLIAEIVDAIHDVDPDRICIVPYPYIIGSYGVDFSKWKADLDAVGLTNKPYVMFDVAHPYFMENEWDMGMTPEQKASWVGNGQLAPAVAAFGADRCFAGETFPWLGEMTPASPNVPSHQPDPDLQLRWTIAIINEYAKYGVSFDLWSCTGNSKWPVTTQAIDASNYKVSSSEIQYTDTNIVHSPEQWKFIAGAGGAGGVITFMPEDIAQHVMDLGANGVYLPVYSDGWGSEVYQHNGLTQTEHKIRYAKEIHRLGGLVYFQVYPYSFQLDTDWDVHVEKETEVIYNTGGMQDTYIQWAKNVINGGYLYGSYVEGINPEIVQIMNEVKGDLASGYATEAFWDKYIDFCNRYMDEISQTKPGVVFTVSSVPFWDLNEIAKHANEFVVPEGSELYFSFHYYYSLWNYPPSSSEAGSLAYWNNLNPLTQAQWDNARDIAFNDYYLNKRGIKALLDMGKKVIWDEVGTNIHNVNIEEWMRDVREFSDTYAIGTSFLDNTVHEGEAYNQMPGALWDDGTWNLNYLGQLWSQIIKPGGTSGSSGTGGTTSSENLVKVPDDFTNEIDYWGYISYDTSVTHNGHPSIRVDADYERGTREVNAIWPSVKPGDHIYWGCWVKTTDDVENTIYTGARVGVDLAVNFGQRYYDAEHPDGVFQLTTDTQPHGYTSSIDGQVRSGKIPTSHYSGTAPEVYLGNPLVSQFKAPFGTTEWKWIYLDFIVPDAFYNMNAFGNVDFGDLTGTESWQLNIAAPWMDARELTDGTVWFADCEFYINPTETTGGTSVSPTPTPQATCSGEDIGQSGCGANQICCCSGTFVPQGGDITYLTCDKLCLGMYGSKYSGTCIAGECTSGKTPETPACSGTCCCFETSPNPTPSPSGDSEISNAAWLFPYSWWYDEDGDGIKESQRHLPWTGHYWNTQYHWNGPDPNPKGLIGLGNEYENPQYIIDNLQGMNIDALIIYGGTWNSDGTIKYDAIDLKNPNEDAIVAKWKNLITKVREAYPNMKFLTWILSGGLHNGGPDLRNSATRAKMVESALAFINRVGLDGWNEDYEGWGWYKDSNGNTFYDSSRLVYLKNYYQELATAMKNNNKIITVATEVNWGGYSTNDYGYILNSDIDYVTPMYYGHGCNKDATNWNRILDNSPCPVLMGIEPWCGVDTSTWTYWMTFDKQLEWFGTQKQTNLAGYSFWVYDHMSYDDMDDWRAWPNK